MESADQPGAAKRRKNAANQPALYKECLNAPAHWRRVDAVSQSKRISLRQEVEGNSPNRTEAWLIH